MFLTELNVTVPAVWWTEAPDDDADVGVYLRRHGFGCDFGCLSNNQGHIKMVIMMSDVMGSASYRQIRRERVWSVNGQLITVICREASSDVGCHWSAPRQPFLAALPWLQGHGMSQAPCPRSRNPDCLIWNGIPCVEKKKTLENAFLLLLYNWNPVPNFIKLWGYDCMKPADQPTYVPWISLILELFKTRLKGLLL